MTSITNSSITEDRYIANLAGMKSNKKALEGINKFRGSGQGSPLRKGISTALLGAFAYPLINSDMRATILGSTSFLGIPLVSSACSLRAYSITKFTADLAFSVLPYIDPKATYSSIEKSIVSTFASLGIGVNTAIESATDNKINMGCRAVNYLGSVGDTLSENYMMIGAAAVNLAVLFALTNIIKDRYDRQAEKDTKNALTDRFEKIAARLTALDASDEVKGCAEKILERRLEINTEIENLKLPNLNCQKIEKITQPLFDAAQKKLNDRK